MDSDQPDGPAWFRHAGRGGWARPGSARSRWRAGSRRSPGRSEPRSAPRGRLSGNGSGHPCGSRRRSPVRDARCRRPLVRASRPGRCTALPLGARSGAGRSQGFRSGRSSCVRPSRWVPRKSAPRRSVAFRRRSRRGSSGRPYSTGNRSGHPVRPPFDRFRPPRPLEPFRPRHRDRLHPSGLRLRTVPSRTGRWVRSGGSCARSSAVPPRRRPRNPPPPRRLRWPRLLGGQIQLPRRPERSARGRAEPPRRIGEPRPPRQHPGRSRTPSGPPSAR